MYILWIILQKLCCFERTSPWCLSFEKDYSAVFCFHRMGGKKVALESVSVDLPAEIEVPERTLGCMEDRFGLFLYMQKERWFEQV